MHKREPGFRSGAFRVHPTHPRHTTAHTHACRQACTRFNKKYMLYLTARQQEACAF